jgi:hypothetical protein
LFSKATIGIPLFISKEKGFGFSKLLWNKTTLLSGRIILSGKTMEKKKEAKNKRKTTKKNFFCSCNEIAEEKLAPKDLEEAKVFSLQNQVDVDEADEDYIPLVQDNSKPQITTAGEESDQEVKVVEERMSEEDLLKAMQDNMVDKKNNRRSF